jgi:hypothetical protein
MNSDGLNTSSRKEGIDMKKVNSTKNQADSITTRLTCLLLGGGIGALVALLFAPKSGRELRGDLADATRKGIERPFLADAPPYDTAGASISALPGDEDFPEAERERGASHELG